MTGIQVKGKGAIDMSYVTFLRTGSSTVASVFDKLKVCLKFVCLCFVAASLSNVEVKFIHNSAPRGAERQSKISALSVYVLLFPQLCLDFLFHFRFLLHVKTLYISSFCF